MKKLSAFMKIREFGPARVAAIAAICTGIWFAPPAEGRDLRWLKKPARQQTVFTADAGAVAHVTWGGTALADAKGNIWTGTVPQIAASPPTPAGAGPFTSGHYALGTGADVFDFVGDFTVCVVFTGAANGGTAPVLFGNGGWKEAGWYLQHIGAALYLSTNTGGVEAAISSVAAPDAGVNVVCAGRASGTILLKLNAAATVTGAAAAIATGDGHVARIGAYSAGSNPWDGNVYEVYATTTTPSDASLTALVNAARTRLGL